MWGCSSDSEDDSSPVTPNAEWETIAAQKEAGGIYTRQEPGKWAGKEGTHVPQLSFNAAAKSVTIVTAHPMTAEHWITAIYIRNQDNIVRVSKRSAHQEVDAQARGAANLPKSVLPDGFAERLDERGVVRNGSNWLRGRASASPPVSSPPVLLLLATRLHPVQHLCGAARCFSNRADLGWGSVPGPR
jgi:desulfoferrodoxin (superoxide reductase-like protein)